MPYRWIDGLTSADVALEATGADLGEVFRAAWEATVATMLDPGEAPAGCDHRGFSMAAPSWEALLLALLEKIVYVKDAEGVLLAPLSVNLAEVAGGVRLEARAACIPVEVVLGRLGTDVKGVTLHRFRLARVEGGWSATAILDV